MHFSTKGAVVGFCAAIDGPPRYKGGDRPDRGAGEGFQAGDAINLWITAGKSARALVFAGFQGGRPSRSLRRSGAAAGRRSTGSVVNNNESTSPGAPRRRARVGGCGPASATLQTKTPPGG